MATDANVVTLEPAAARLPVRAAVAGLRPCDAAAGDTRRVRLVHLRVHPMIGEYVTPALVGGARGLMVVNVIVSQFHALRFGVGSAMVFVLTALALVLMLVLRRRPGTHDHRPMLAFLGPGSAVQCFALHPG